MQVLIIGQGAREHALAWALSKSEDVTKISCLPGNAGTALTPKCENILFPQSHWDTIASWAKTRQIDLTLVGPEAPLAQGIVNSFLEQGLAILGPTREAARLEWSKLFAKEIMTACQIPTADYAILPSIDQAESYLKACDYPIVLKVDGLASGKGVRVCYTENESLDFAHLVLQQEIFGKQQTLFAEEFISGEEASFTAITDGQHCLTLASSQDHKRLLDQEQGPNTGGMGAYSPAPILTAQTTSYVETNVVEPLLKEMRRRGTPFRGILYVGLMITDLGPKVLEFNVRLGDPEAQVIVRRLRSDLAQLLLAATANLKTTQIAWHDEFAIGVVLASAGYPLSPQKGHVISGIEPIGETIVNFHGSTCLKNQQLVTDGGRIVTVTALGRTIDIAAQRAYQQVKHIQFEGKCYRSDIGWRILRRS